MSNESEPGQEEDTQEALLATVTTEQNALTLAPPSGIFLEIDPDSLVKN
jgi:hypothetical protein